jgi:nitrate reductase gamma subunit|nr:MAG: nitrate reductase [Vulcanisaeta sp. AZ3]
MPYVILLIFLAGIVYRIVKWLMPKGLLGLYNVNVTVGDDTYGKITKEILKRMFLMYTLQGTDNSLFIGSLLFHWGIWIALIGHLGLIIPSSWLYMTPEEHYLIAHVIGGAAGVMALAGISILLGRRLVTREVNVMGHSVKIPMRMFSFLDDYFADVVLLLIIILGLLQTLWLHPAFETTITPWIWSLAKFAPDASYIISAPLITQIHVFLAMIFIAYIPWSKMIHPFTFIYISPTVARPSIKTRPVKYV